MGVALAGANVHDTKLLKQTIEAIVVDRPEPSQRKPQHLCLDKAYDNPTGHAVVAATDYTPHVRRIGCRADTWLAEQVSWNLDSVCEEVMQLPGHYSVGLWPVVVSSSTPAGPFEIVSKTSPATAARTATWSCRFCFSRRPIRSSRDMMHLLAVETSYSLSIGSL